MCCINVDKKERIKLNVFFNFWILFVTQLFSNKIIIKTIKRMDTEKNVSTWYWNDFFFWIFLLEKKVLFCLPFIFGQIYELSSRLSL